MTTGVKLNMDTQKANPEYAFVGFYKTKSEAVTALAEYHRNPYDLSHGNTTFEEAYDAWSRRRYDELKNTTPYKSAYKILSPIKDKRLTDLTFGMIQDCFDHSGKNAPMLAFAKIIVTAVYKEAAKGSIVTNEVYERMKLLEVGNSNPDANPHKRIEAQDLDKIWKCSEQDSAKFVLILCYTGCRISEILRLKRDRINLEKRYFSLDDAKTPSGIRDVPIADKILPFFVQFIERNTKYLCGDSCNYTTWMKYKWMPFMQSLGMDYLPHDCRVTCVSLLTDAEVDARIIKSIVGHKGSDVTEQVYTRISMDKKLDAINKI